MKNYWNMNGQEQEKLNEMEAINFAYTQATEKAFHSYYRYYNDGDLPGWARTRWDLTTYSYDYGYVQRKLNEKGELEQEKRITAQILLEYKRFLKEMAK